MVDRAGAGDRRPRRALRAADGVRRARRARRVGRALDLARTVVRRAERHALAAAEPPSLVVPYLNRLSDLLWTMARWQESQTGSTRTARSLAGGGPASRPRSRTHPRTPPISRSPPHDLRRHRPQRHPATSTWSACRSPATGRSPRQARPVAGGARRARVRGQARPDAGACPSATAPTVIAVGVGDGRRAHGGDAAHRGRRAGPGRGSKRTTLATSLADADGVDARRRRRRSSRASCSAAYRYAALQEGQAGAAELERVTLTVPPGKAAAAAAGAERGRRRHGRRRLPATSPTRRRRT